MYEARPPRRGGKVLPWDRLKLEGLKLWHGWLAGPPLWLPTHHHNKTLPCRHLLTQGALNCPHQHKEFPPRKRAYVPLWDDTGARMFIVVGDHFEEQLDAAPHLAALAVAKQPAKGLPIKVWVKDWAKGLPPISRAAQQPQDIRHFLLQLWNDPELKGFFADHPMGPLPVSVPVPTVDTERLPAAFGESQRLARARGVEVLADLLPERNGKGHK